MLLPADGFDRDFLCLFVHIVEDAIDSCPELPFGEVVRTKRFPTASRLERLDCQLPLDCGEDGRLPPLGGTPKASSALSVKLMVNMRAVAHTAACGETSVSRLLKLRRRLIAAR